MSCSRGSAPSYAAAQRDPTRLEAADIEVNLRTRDVRRLGESVHLTAREFELLMYLMRHPNQVLSREQILNAVWGYDFDPRDQCPERLHQ